MLEFPKSTVKAAKGTAKETWSAGDSAGGSAGETAGESAVALGWLKGVFSRGCF